MREEYTEYRGRQRRTVKKGKKHKSYLFKFLKQTISSVIIFSLIISPETAGLEIGKKIKAITKSALFYKMDTSILQDALKIRKGEQSDAKETSVLQDI